MTVLDPSPLRPRPAFDAAPFDDPDRYRRLLRGAPATGRCPVLLTPAAVAALPRGWDPAPALAVVAERDVGVVLAAGYPDGCVFHTDCLAPFGRSFPGLAAATTGAELLTPDDVVEAAVEVAEGPGGERLAVVPVARAADVLAALGWPGEWTRDAAEPEPDPLAVSVVLRSWEERFGAVLVRLGRAALEVSVAAPPWTAPECRAVAAEHYGFCEDVFTGYPGTLRDYATQLRGVTRWRFAWR